MLIIKNEKNITGMVTFKRSLKKMLIIRDTNR